MNFFILLKLKLSLKTLTRLQAIISLLNEKRLLLSVLQTFFMALMRGLIGEAMVLVTRQEWETKQVDYLCGWEHGERV